MFHKILERGGDSKIRTMSKNGFEDYTYACYGRKNGTADSYIRAIRILDVIFRQSDVFALGGVSLCDIDNLELLISISEFVKKRGV